MFPVARGDLARPQQHEDVGRAELTVDDSAVAKARAEAKIAFDERRQPPHEGAYLLLDGSLSERALGGDDVEPVAGPGDGVQLRGHSRRPRPVQ